MQIQNSFDVPLPPEEAWKVLLDISRIAPCLPGAQLTEIVDDKTYRGKVGLRLGPVALAFNGVAIFEEVDEISHRARVRAQGSDAKGRGGASAIVSFRLSPTAGGTQVSVDTDLTLSGSIAQYGRASGIIHQVATELVSQFSHALKSKIEISGAEVSTETTLPLHSDSPKSISGFSLIGRVLWQIIARVFRRGGATN
jgi:carbon monoxide dehydrogenase subunit G